MTDINVTSCCSDESSVNIYSTRPGTVVAMTNVGPAIAFSVDSSAYTFNQLNAIATSVGISGQAGFQFMHSLREFIYVYVFTERIGEIVVNGLAFPASCDETEIGPQATTPPIACVSENALATTGLERIMLWYECNRITSRAEPITIALGAGVSYQAFLISVKADVANAETGIAQFALRFNYVPHISDDDDFCFALDDSCLDIPCTQGDAETGSNQ